MFIFEKNHHSNKFTLSLKYRKIISNSLYFFLLSLTIVTFFLIIMVLVSGGFSLKFGFLKISLRGLSNISIEFFISSFLLTVFFYKKVRNIYSLIEKSLSKSSFFISFLILLILFLYFWWWGYSYPVKVDGDGVGYYSYLRSIFMDGDLNFANEFEKLESWKYGLPLPSERTFTGYVSNPYSIGPAILWSPFFLLAFLISHIINLFGGNVSIDGYSTLFVIFASSGTKIYGFLGIILLWKSLRLLYKEESSFFSTVFMMLATPLTYYLAFEPFMSHVHSFFLISLMLYLWLRNLREESFKKWFILGGINGLIALTRWQDATFFLLPPIFLILNSFSLRNVLHWFKKNISYFILYILTFLIVFSPQIIVFKIIYGFWFGVPQGKDFIGYVPKYLFEVLFSPKHGLFNWHPILLFAFLGLLSNTLKKNLLGGVFLTGFIFQWLFNSTLPQWWGGHAFGMRRLINCIPLLAFGLATFLSWTRKVPIFKYFTISLFVFLSIINIYAIKGYIFQIVPHEEPFSYFQILKVSLPQIKSSFLGTQIKNLFALITFLCWVFYNWWLLERVKLKNINEKRNSV